LHYSELNKYGKADTILAHLQDDKRTTVMLEILMIDLMKTRE